MPATQQRGALIPAPGPAAVDLLALRQGQDALPATGTRQDAREDHRGGEEERGEATAHERS
jgi:hypothetical protein